MQTNVELPNVLQIAGPMTGHDMVRYSPTQYAEAQKTFDELVGKRGYTAFNQRPNGMSEMTRSFNPAEPVTSLFPRVVGG